MRNADYDATMEMMTADGTEDLETQKSDIDIGRHALGIQKEVPPQQVFDFRLVGKSIRSCVKPDSTGC